MVAPTYGFQVSDKKKIQQTNKNLYVMLSTGGAFSFKVCSFDYPRVILAQWMLETGGKVQTI